MSTTHLLDKREVRIRRMFGQIAPWYDFLNHFLSLNIDKLWRKKTVKLVPPHSHEQGPILDLCTGTGDLAFAYAKVACADVPIIGADFCHEMLVRALQKSRPNETQRILFVEADAQALPFADNTFQLVSNAFGLRNITDTDRGLAEMVRVLRPGGRLAVLEFSRPHNSFFGRMYTFYFRHILPKLGQLICRNAENAYTYLPESALRFPNNEQLVAKMQSHGLTDVQFVPFTFGIATLYVGVKK